MTQQAERITSSTLPRPQRLYDAYLFDMDGTIYLGDEVLPGARRLIATLHRLGKKVRFLTNNPRYAPEEYVARLAAMGIEAQPQEIITSAITMALWLKQQHPHAAVYPIGERPLRQALDDAGIRVTENPAEIDIVIGSVDRTLTYDKLQIAFEALWYYKRARLVRTNPGRFCPMENGRAELDTGAVIGALETTTGVTCEINTGKPHPIMLDTVIEELGLAPADCVMTGDLLTTDMRMARAAGMPGALVLSGQTSRDAAERAPDDRRPTFILERIDHLLPDAIWAELGDEA